MNLAKYISDQHEENYKALMNEIKEELNKWRDKPCFQGQEDSIFLFFLNLFILIGG